jgi:hypothetical protein
MIPITFPRAISTSPARFASKDELNLWLSTHPTYRTAARLIRPKTTPGECFALLVEYPDARTREQAQLEDELHQLHAMRSYQSASQRVPVRDECDVI